MISFIHGWGFDKRFWGGVARSFPAELWDLGFFSAAELYPPKDKIVCHSYGLVWLLGRYPNPKARIIAFNAVPSFSKLIAPRLLARMVNRWRDEPGTVLANFLARVNAETRKPAADTTALTKALVELATADVTAQAAALGANLLLVGSEDDEILPAAKQRRLRIRLLKSGGHILPKSRPRECASLIRSHLYG